jgi:hypothetical protein
MFIAALAYSYISLGAIGLPSFIAKIMESLSCGMPVPSENEYPLNIPMPI